MSEPTEQDRETVRVLVDEYFADSSAKATRAACAEEIAAALAAEREKARAPFLALADELDELHIDPWVTIEGEAMRTADLIRRAAEDAP